MTDLLIPSTFTLDNPLVSGLACAVLSSGLRSILVLDTNPVTMRALASGFAQMLEQTTHQVVTQVQVDSFATENNLWGKLIASPSDEFNELPIYWQSGVLGSPEQKDSPRLVLLPDLTQLSLAAARACVSVANAEVIHLERHGQSTFWKPNLVWLAGCMRDSIGSVSPHLLDRFALRLTGKLILERDRTSFLLAQLEEQSFSLDTESVVIPANIIQTLQQAAQCRTRLTHAALRRVEEYGQSLNTYSSRREIALARLSLALAQLKGQNLTTDEHVNSAAQLIGLQPPSASTDLANNIQLSANESEILAPETTNTEEVPLLEPKPNEIIASPKVKRAIYESDQTATIEPITLLEHEIEKDPYPEDSAPIEREALSLKLPPRRSRVKAITRGAVIGVKPAQTFADLALVSTVLEAAKYQTIRKQQLSDRKLSSSKLILSPADFRCYRRAMVAEQMLALVIDHTCLKECDWRNTLLPYLSWAYQERASICLIQVGQKCHTLNAQLPNGEIQPDELRANKLIEQSILVPRISAAIEVEAGKATPLAHGLELVLQTLRHATQHGRSRLQKALLVVITDGRGNIPLEASYSGKIQPFLPVKRKGIEDAITIAQQIQQLDNVNTVLLNPKPLHHSELPLKLAKAMKARILDILPSEKWEIDD